MDFDICYNQIPLLKSTSDRRGLNVLDLGCLLLFASRIYKEQLRHALQQAHDNALKIDLAKAD